MTGINFEVRIKVEGGTPRSGSIYHMHPSGSLRRPVPGYPESHNVASTELDLVKVEFVRWGERQ